MPGFDIVDFDPDRINSGELFPNSIERDPWVMFHGTSSSQAKSIEDRGFTYASHPVQKKHVEDLAQIFRDMRWSGSDPGGFGVLDAFSKTDLVDDASPVFFAETGMRGLLYATRDFAGGEKLRAIRRSWRDLERFLNDDSVRSDHYADLDRRLRARQAAGALMEPDWLSKVDLDWLDARMTELKSVADIALAAEDHHEAGAIYALRFNEADAGLLSYSHSMGLSAKETIPFSRVIAKMEVPATFNNAFISRPTSDWVLGKMAEGLIDRLTRASA